MNTSGNSSVTCQSESDFSAIVDPTKDYRYVGKDLFSFPVCNLCGHSSFFLIYLGENERAVKYRYTKKVQLYCPPCIPDPDHYRQIFPGEDVYQAGSVLNDRNLLSLLEGYDYCNPYYKKYLNKERIIITENTKLRSSYKPLTKRPIPKMRKMELLMGLFIDSHRMPFQKFANISEHLHRKYIEICESYMNLSGTEALQMHDMFDTLIEKTPRHLKQTSQSQRSKMDFPSPIVEDPAEANASEISSISSVEEMVCHLGPQIDVLRSLETSSSGSDQASIGSDIHLSSQDVSVRERPASSQSALQISSQSASYDGVVPSSQSVGETSSQNPFQISSQSLSGQAIVPSSLSTAYISSQNVASQELVAIPPAQSESSSFEVNISSQEMQIIADIDSSTDSVRTTRRRRSASPTPTNSPIQLDDQQPGPSGLNQPRTKRPRQELPVNPTPEETVRNPNGARMPRLAGG